MAAEMDLSHGLTKPRSGYVVAEKPEVVVIFGILITGEAEMVTVEIDIAADGSITATPNPVPVPSGETLFFHVNSNASEATKFTTHFPVGDPKSPFIGQGDTTVPARRCLGAGSRVNWPPGVNRATVTVSAHGSPIIGSLQVLVVRSMRPASSSRIHPMPYIVQNYYFATDDDFIGLGGDELEQLSGEGVAEAPVGAGVGKTFDKNCGDSIPVTTFGEEMDQVTVTIANNGDCSVTVKMDNANGQEVTKSTVPPKTPKIAISGNNVKTVSISCGGSAATGKCKFEYSISAS